MEKADIVVSERYEADMSHAVPIEPHAVVAQWQGDKVTIWSSTQVPFIARAGVATTLEMPESHVRVIVPYLGGGFGGKCEFHYEAHIAALSRAAKRPVRLVSRPASCRTARSSPGARGWCLTAVVTPRTTRSSRSWPP
jgi:CO/xanthine dehydrogenase Mo-binding subunit